MLDGGFSLPSATSKGKNVVSNFSPLHVQLQNLWFPFLRWPSGYTLFFFLLPRIWSIISTVLLGSESIDQISIELHVEPYHSFILRSFLALLSLKTQRSMLIFWEKLVLGSSLHHQSYNSLHHNLPHHTFIKRSLL